MFESLAPQPEQLLIQGSEATLGFGDVIDEMSVVNDQTVVVVADEVTIVPAAEVHEIVRRVGWTTWTKPTRSI